MLAGPATGAVYWAARQYLREHPAPAAPPRRASIACGRLESYLSYVRQCRPDRFGQARRPAPADVPDEVAAVAAGLAAMPAGPALCVGTRGGHGLPDGWVNIPDDDLEDMLRHGNPFPWSRRVVFACPAGEYSRRLAAFLRQAGTTPGSRWNPGSCHRRYRPQENPGAYAPVRSAS